MPNSEEKDIDFKEEDTSLEDLYDDEFSDMDEDDEEEADDEEKAATTFESKPNTKKNKIIIGAVVGAIAVIGLGAMFKNAQNKKAAAKKEAEAQNQTEDVLNNGTENTDQTSSSNDLLGNTDNKTANGDLNLDPNAGTPCDLTNPDPNNPNCKAVQTQETATTQPATNTTTQPEQIPQETSNTTSNYTDNSGSNNSGSYENGNSGGSGGYYSRPVHVKKPKSEIPLPSAPQQYQAKEIKKPNSTLNVLGNNKSSNSSVANNPSATTTKGIEGQSQAEADKINSTQNRVRPSTDIKTADNKTTFLLQTGTYIPLAITTTINSDNPSYFMGIVRENVYSQNGMHKLLIPMGSKIIGNYKALAGNMDTRMFLFVEKIILPNQQVIAFANENIVDLNGEIGTRGKLNGRFWQRLGNTALALTFNAADIALDFRRANAATKAAENSNGANISTSTWETVLGSPTQKLRSVGKELNEAWGVPKNRIKVPIGSRLNVLVSNDIVLPEYKGR